jgi:hypothetical protein
MGYFFLYFFTYGCIKVSNFSCSKNNSFVRQNKNKKELLTSIILTFKRIYLTTEQILNQKNIVPEEVTLEDKPDFEKLHLIN